MVAGGKIRVLVVDDSTTVRKHLVDVLRTSKDIEAVGEAENGEQAIKLCDHLKPDLVSLDLVMPSMDGVAVTEQIMAHVPTPILIVSAASNRGELLKTYDALAAGAVDVLEKPTGAEFGDAWGKDFLSKIRFASRIRVILHPRAKLRTIRPRQPNGTPASITPPPAPGAERAHRVIAIGAAGGGLSGLLPIVEKLPGDSDVPVLLVVQLDDAFASALPEWLREHSALPVSHAREGDPLERRGRLIVAPPGVNLFVRDRLLHLANEGPTPRPSIDALMRSLSEGFGDGAIACLLPSEGRDGWQGLLSIRLRKGRSLVAKEVPWLPSGGKNPLMDTAAEAVPFGSLPAMVATLARPD